MGEFEADVVCRDFENEEQGNLYFVSLRENSSARIEKVLRWEYEFRESILFIYYMYSAYIPTRGCAPAFIETQRPFYTIAKEDVALDFKFFERVDGEYKEIDFDIEEELKSGGKDERL